MVLTNIYILHESKIRSVVHSALTNWTADITLSFVKLSLCKILCHTAIT